MSSLFGARAVPLMLPPFQPHPVLYRPIPPGLSSLELFRYEYTSSPLGEILRTNIELDHLYFKLTELSAARWCSYRSNATPYLRQFWPSRAARPRAISMMEGTKLSNISPREQVSGSDDLSL